MTSERLLNLSIEVLYSKKLLYPKNKFMAIGYAPGSQEFVLEGAHRCRRWARSLKSGSLWDRSDSVVACSIFDSRLSMSHYCQQLTLSVCLSVCLSQKLQIAFYFLSLDGIEPFLEVSSPWPPLQNVVFRFFFDSDPLTPKIYSPKFAQNRL